MIFFLLAALFVAIFLEATIFSLPFTIAILVVMSIFWKKAWVFFVAIIVGFFLDSLLFRQLGTTSLFYLFLVGTIFLYSRKFETENIVFAVGAATFTTLLYVTFFSGISIGILGQILLINLVTIVVFPLVRLSESRHKLASKNNP